jgi:hypothetical protein
MGVKIDLDNFEYNSKYKLPNEHCWDKLKDNEDEKKYFDEREELGKPKRGIVASNPEVVGQVGSMISVGDLSSITFETNRVD